MNFQACGAYAARAGRADRHKPATRLPKRLPKSRLNVFIPLSLLKRAYGTSIHAIEGYNHILPCLSCLLLDLPSIPIRVE